MKVAAPAHRMKGRVAKHRRWSRASGGIRLEWINAGLRLARLFLAYAPAVWSGVGVEPLRSE